MKRVTIHDIAKELNVTFSTVARALNNHPAISAATKKAVNETAQRLNYRQNKIASSLRSGKTNTVGIIVPNLHVSFFSSVVSGIERVMNENGYTALLYQSNESFTQEIKGIEKFLQLGVDAIFASVTTETDNFQYYEEVKKRNVPLILFDRVFDDGHFPCVLINDYKGGFLATKHLIEQGYKQIVHITAEQNIKIFKERLRGYLDALRNYNLPVNEDLIIEGKFSLGFGKECINHLLSTKIPFDAVFALEDFTALGAVQQLKSHRLKIPEEVGVIGFANESFGSHVTPSLSTIDQQTNTMGEEVAKLFLEMQKNHEKAVDKIELDPILLMRESTDKKALILR